MSITTTQILNLARKKMLEEGTEIISEENALIYANFTYQDLIKRTFPNSAIKSATISFTNGVGTLPSDFGTLYGDAYVNSQNIFPEYSIADFARQQFGNGITIENATMKVYPTSTPLVYIKYYPTWADLSLVQNPQTNDYFSECIIYGILARAYEDLQDEQLAKYYDDKYEAKLAQKKSVISEYEEDNQRGGQMFNYIPLVGGESGGGVSPDYF